jgi:hypothetical protein
VLYLRLIIFLVGSDVSADSEALLVIDFVNLKIKSAQSFEGAHKDRIYVCVHTSEYSYVYDDLCLYCISKKTWCHHRRKLFLFPLEPGS